MYFELSFAVQILHSVVGLVKSNPVLTAFQVFSRVFLLWGVVWSVPEVGADSIEHWLCA